MGENEKMCLVFYRKKSYEFFGQPNIISHFVFGEHYFPHCPLLNNIVPQTGADSFPQEKTRGVL